MDDTERRAEALRLATHQAHNETLDKTIVRAAAYYAFLTPPKAAELHLRAATQSGLA